MPYPDLGNWNGKQPTESEDTAVTIAEAMAWSALDRLTAGRVAFDITTVRPENVDADGAVVLAGPVGGVTEVRIDGIAVSPALWRVDGNRLIYLNTQSWPTAQDLTLGVGVVGSFEVDYFWGWRPGKLLVWAAAELAFEFYKAASGGKNCRLPKNVTAITRQGVSFEMASPLFDNGRTGIHEIDVVLARYNPNGLSLQSIVATPESLAMSRRIG